MLLTLGGIFLGGYSGGLLALAGPPGILSPTLTSRPPPGIRVMLPSHLTSSLPERPP